MIVSVASGFAENGKTMDWIRVKSLGAGSYGVVDLIKPITWGSDQQLLLAAKYCLYQRSGSLQKERYVLRQFAGCSNIVQCYGAILRFDDRGFSFYNLLLEYALYGTLSDLIKGYGGNIPESNVKCYTKMLLEGIRCIHGKGYVHCDLKPDNILVFPPAPDLYDSDLNLKIADFGLVRRPGETYTTVVGNMRFPGTPRYMPPEEEISPKLDVWSLGCIVLQMITRKLPWEDVTKTTDLAISIRFSTSLPNEIPETLSEEGKDFVKKCLARDPSERWSAEMLLSHPFLAPDPTKCFDFLPSMEELEASLCL